MSFNLEVGSIRAIELPNDVVRKNRISGTINTTVIGIKRIVLLNRVTMKVIGSCVARSDNTWDIYADFPEDAQLLVVCLDETETYNADAFDRVSMCTTDYSYDAVVTKKMALSNRKSFKRNLYPAIYNKRFPWEYETLVEDVKGNITGFSFDEIGESGQFTNIGDSPISIGAGGSEFKVGKKSLVYFDSFNSPIVSPILNYNSNGIGESAVNLTKSKVGNKYTPDIFGDDSCMLFMPLDHDVRHYGNTPANIEPVKIKFVENDEIEHPFGERGFTLKNAMDSYLSTGLRLPPYSSTVSYSFSFWFKTPEWPSTSWPYFVFQPGSFYIRVYSSSRFCVYCYTPAGTWSSYIVGSSTYMKPNVWTHWVVCLGTGNTVTLYINGVQQYNSTSLQPWGEAVNGEPIVSYEGSLSLLNRPEGRLFWAIGVSDTIMQMSTFRLFNRRVTAGEVTTLYEERPDTGGKESVQLISNINTGDNKILQVENSVNQYNSVLFKSVQESVRPLAHTDIESVQVPFNYSGKYEKIIYKGSIYRQHLAKSRYYNSDSNYKSRAWFLFNDDLSQSNSQWWQYWSDARKENDYAWFFIDLGKRAWFNGLSFWRASPGLSTYNTLQPSILDVYYSNTGEFLGEERYGGRLVFAKTLTSTHTRTPISRLDSPVYGRYIKFVIKDSYRVISGSSSTVFANSLQLELLEPVHFEAKKARTFVLDIYSNHSTTLNIGFRRFVPTLNGMPLSTADWTFLCNRTGGEDDLKDALDSTNIMNFLSKAWYSLGTTFGRIIMIAPEDVYFDDLYFQNYYNSWSTSTIYTSRGIKDVRITYTDEVYQNTEPDAPITGGKEICKTIVPQHIYLDNQSASMTYLYNDMFVDFEVGGYIGNTFKPVVARTVAFDFSSNHGNLTHMGVKRIEFWYRGTRLHTNYITATSGASSNSGSIATTFLVSGIGYTTTNSWVSASGQVSNQRIWIRFSANTKFDLIRILNHNEGTNPSLDVAKKGIADVTIYGSLQVTTPSGYGSPLTDQFLIKPFTEVPMAYRITDTATYHHKYGFYSMPLNMVKSDSWKCRSIVFDFHSNWGSNSIGLKQLLFSKNAFPIPYKTTWLVYAQDQDASFLAVDAVKGYLNPNWGVGANQAWKANKKGQTRIVIVFDQEKKFDEIKYINWFDIGKPGMDTFSGVREVTIQITDSILGTSDAVYEKEVSGGTVIFNGAIPKRQHHENFYSNPLEKIEKISTSYYSKDIDLLIQSNTYNGNTEFTDVSVIENAVLPTGVISHSTAQSIIGSSSIDVRTGFLNVPDLRRFPIDNATFEIGMYVYPLSVSGDTGLFSRWEPTRNHLSYKLCINNGKVEFTYSSNGSNSVVFTSTGGVLEDEWTWICVKRSGEVFTIFINDMLDSTHTLTDLINESMANICIGSFDQDLDNCFQGFLNLVVYKSHHIPEPYTETPPVDFIPISMEIYDVNVSIYYAFCFDTECSCFKVWNNSSWRPIVTKDPTIHGVTGDEEWYYREDGLNWIKSPVNNPTNAMSLSTVFANNQMKKDDVESLTSVEIGRASCRERVLVKV